MKRPGNILPIALMAFAIVALLLLIDLSGDVFRNGTIVMNKSKTNTDSGLSQQMPADLNSNVNEMVVNTTNSEEIDETAEWKTYENETYGFALKYPKTFQDFAPATAYGTGYRGTALVVAGSSDPKDNANILISVKDAKYDPNNIEGLYGKVEAEDVTAIELGTQTGSMYLDGDAGCGAQEVLTSIKTVKTLWIAFGDCEDTATMTNFYDNEFLIDQILSTVTFTN